MDMHKKMSRIVVLLLVICLTLGNVVPVLAADDTGSTDTVTPLLGFTWIVT